MEKDAGRWLRIVVVLLSVAFGSGIFIWAQDMPSTPASAQGGATATPTAGPWHEQLQSESDALLKAVDDEWPQYVAITHWAARLVDYSTALQWLGDTDISRSGDEPVWIVGLMTTDPVTLDDVMFPGVTSGSNSAALPWTIGGGYYVWDANSGNLIRKGALFDQWSSVDAQPKFEHLEALESRSIPIVTPSPAATYGASPDHTPDT